MISSKRGIVYELFEGNGTKEQNLVFIHGSGCNKKFLQAMQTCLEQYNCYFIDLPGHGETEEKTYSVESYVDAICDFVKDMDNVVLIGHSLGGTLVLETSSRKVPAVKKAVVISSGATFPKLDKQFMEKIHNNIVDMDYLIQCCGHLDKNDVLTALNNLEAEEIIIKDFIIDEFVDVTASLKNISIPTLLITGGDEILTLVEYSELVNREVESSSLVIVPKARHMLPIGEKEQVCELIKGFI